MTGRWPPTVSLVLLAFVAVGAITLVQDLDGVWILVAALPLAVYAVLRSIPAPRAIRAIALVWGLVVIPVYALLGVDWLWAHLTSWRPDPLGSLVLGALLIGGAAWLYLRPWWVRRTPPRPLAWTVGAALILVLVPPFGFWFAGWVKGDERSLEQKASVVSRLDVIVLTDETERPAEPAPPFGWSISTWRGQVGEGRSHSLGCGRSATARASRRRGPRSPVDGRRRPGAPRPGGGPAGGSGRAAARSRGGLVWPTGSRRPSRPRSPCCAPTTTPA